MSDLIDRRAAIDALERTKEKDPKGDIACFYNTIIDNKIAVIEALPSASPKRCADCENLSKTQLLIPQPEQRWIPCSERLPDMHDEVLVTARGEVSIAWLYVDGKWRSNDMPQPMLRDIIAWMPLPEPWRGEER